MKCSYCAETIKNDALKCKHCGEWVKDSRECPECAEVVRQSARICKHCGNSLGGVRKEPVSEKSPSDAFSDARTIMEASQRFANALPEALNQMSTVTQCLVICEEYFGGRVPGKAEVKEFVDTVAEIRQWKGRTADTRKSEVRVLVGQYHRLPSACKAVVADKRNKKFSWHDAVRVGRLCRDHTTDKAVVAAFYHGKR